MKLLICILCVTLLSACKTTQLSNNAYTVTEAVPASLYEKKQLLPVLVVRLVAAIDPASKDQIERLYSERMMLSPRTGMMSFQKTNDQNIDENALQNALGKTAYYTLELYGHLKKNLPNINIILQPVRLALDDLGNVITTTSYKISYASVVVDFFAHYDPNTTPLNFYQKCTTYGNQICPFVSISSPRVLSEETAGLVSATKMTLAALNAESGNLSDTKANSDIATLLNHSTKLRGDIPKKFEDLILNERPLSAGKLFVLPDGPFLAGELGRKVHFGELSVGDALYQFDSSTEWTMRPYVNLVRDQLVNIWDHASLNKVYSPYIRFYDPDLADAIMNEKPVDKLMENKISAIGEIVAEERAYLQNRTEELTATLAENGWRDGVINYLKLERKISGKAMADEGMEMMGAMAAGMGAVAAAKSNDPNVQKIGELAMTTGIAMTVSFGASAEVINEFSSFFSGTNEEQTKYVVDMLGLKVEIEAKDIPGLRFEMRQMYRDYFKL